MLRTGHYSGGARHDSDELYSKVAVFLLSAYTAVLTFLLSLTVFGVRAILPLMRALSVIILLAALVLPPLASAEVQTFTATHTYILGDHDSKDDARQRCLLETKRKVLEQAGVYIESASEVKNFDLTKDKITSFAAAVMQVKDTKEEVSFQQGHMRLTLKLTAQVDLVELRKQLAARQVDAGVRDDVAVQKERLKRLEAQLESMMQRQQGGQSSGHAPASPPIDFSAEDLQLLNVQAAQGDAGIQVNLGALYAQGAGVPQDYAKARQLWEQAAAQGNAAGQFFLGVLYDKGRGVPQDYVTARKWFEQAAVQGDAGAQFALGAMYDKGHGVPQDYVKARGWYEQAAAQGNAAAQSNIGSLYENGQSVPQDYVKARGWYEQAAAQGNAAAQFNIGWLYANGQGVSQDDVRAAKWVEKSAAQGYAKAQHFLGMMYALGAGVPKDYVRAYMWSNVAAAHLMGTLQPQAVEYRDKVARRMSPAQIAEAQRLSQQCQAQQFKGC